MCGKIHAIFLNGVIFESGVAPNCDERKDDPDKNARTRETQGTLSPRVGFHSSLTRGMYSACSPFFRRDRTLFKNRVNELNGVMLVSFLSQLSQPQKRFLLHPKR